MMPLVSGACMGECLAAAAVLFGPLEPAVKAFSSFMEPLL